MDDLTSNLQQATPRRSSGRAYISATLALSNAATEQVRLLLAYPSAQRTLSIGAVAIVHVVFVSVLILGVPMSPTKAPEISLALVGGPLGVQREASKLPDLAALQDVQPPPVIEIETPAPATEAMAPSNGSPNVTRPAMAIAEAHAFPALPAAYAGHRSIALRVVLSVARDGSIAAAEIAQTSGIAALDRVAIEWVKQHWRYQPALESGEAIATTEMAVVTFSGPV
jgi:outer membrane biosynthesis protein TonB